LFIKLAELFIKEFSPKTSMKEEVRFHVALGSMQKFAIGASVFLVFIVALFTGFSDSIKMEVLGLYCQLLGSILLGLGLIKTNEELMELADHHEKLERQRLITHLTKDRFFIVIGVFFVVLGILLQIIGNQVFMQ
jgi:hypothetical protein